MNIICENCSSTHAVNLPPWVVSSGRPFRFRCASCGHSQRVFGTESTPTPADAVSGATALPPPTDTVPPVQLKATPPPKPSKEEAKSASIYLKSGDQVYAIPDQATLQQWVMERRVTADDLLSDGGESWAPAGERVELLSFFDAVEKIDAYNELTAETVADATLESPMVLGAFSDIAEITEGVPTGLPPLPTEEHQLTDDVPTMAAEKQTTATPVPLDSIDLSSLDLPFGQEEPIDDAGPGDTSAPPVVSPETLDPVKQAQALSLQLEKQQDSAKPPPPVEEGEPNDFIAEAGSLKPLGDDFSSASEPEHTESAFDDEADLEPVAEGDIDEFYSSFELEASSLDENDDWGPTSATPKPKSKMLIAALTTVGAIAIGGGIYYFGFTGSSASKIQTEEPVVAASHAPEDVEDQATVESVGLPEAAPETTTQADKNIADDAAEPLANKAIVKTTAPPVKAETAPAPKPNIKKSSPPKNSEPAPKKKTKKSRPLGSQKNLISQAWKAVDLDKLEDASRLFQSVLATSPQNADANFGYGYVLMQQGSMSTAKTYLCRAKESAEKSSSTEREVNGILTANGFSC